MDKKNNKPAGEGNAKAKTGHHDIGHTGHNDHKKDERRTGWTQVEDATQVVNPDPESMDSRG